MLIVNILGYFLSFYIIWWGAGLIIDAVCRVANKISLSKFALSFFVLGLLTSIPEFSVGVNSVMVGDPEIFVGNLLGGMIVIFLLIIPILAIAGNGIKLIHQLNTKNLLFSLLVVVIPSFLVADKKINLFEAVLMILFYGVLLFFIEKKKGLLENVRDNLADGKSQILQNVSNIIVGAVVVYFSSSFIVSRTVYFSNLIKISPFVISLIFLSLGTNLPELSLAVRAVAAKKKEVAFGDYIGSAAANTLFIGLLTLFNRGEVIVANHFIRPFIFTVLGLGLFFYFSRSKNDISRKEGLILLLIYIGFLISEIF